MKIDKNIQKILDILDAYMKELYPEYLIYENTIVNRGKSSKLAVEINMVNIESKIFEVMFINDDIYLLDVYDEENMLEDKFLRVEKMEAENGGIVKKQININEYLLTKINKIRNDTTNGD